MAEIGFASGVELKKWGEWTRTPEWSVKLAEVWVKRMEYQIVYFDRDEFGRISSLTSAGFAEYLLDDDGETMQVRYDVGFRCALGGF